MVNLIYHRE